MFNVGDNFFDGERGIEGVMGRMIGGMHNTPYTESCLFPIKKIIIHG